MNPMRCWGAILNLCMTLTRSCWFFKSNMALQKACPSLCSQIDMLFEDIQRRDFSPIRQIARNLTVPLKGMWMSNSGSSSLLSNAGASKFRRSPQGLKISLALPGSNSFKAHTCQRFEEHVRMLETSLEYAYSIVVLMQRLMLHEPLLNPRAKKSRIGRI